MQPLIAVIGANGRWGSKIMQTLKSLSIPYLPANRDNWKNLILTSKCNAVIIATSFSSHISIAEECLKHNLPVLIEKPLATSIKDIDTLIPYTNQIILVNYIHLFSEQVQEIAKQLKFKDILEINSLGFNFGPVRADCSSLFDYGSHDVSMSVYLTKSVPQVISVEKISTSSGEIFDCLLQYDGFKHHMIVGNGATHKRRFLEIKCTGNFRIVYDDMSTDKLTINDACYKLGSVPSLENVINTFIKAIQTGQQDDRFGLDLPYKATNILEQCFKLAS